MPIYAPTSSQTNGGFPTVPLDRNGNQLTPLDCGKCFTDEGTPTDNWWTWVELPNANDCIGLPGIMFKFTRPLGGNLGTYCTSIYPRWEQEGDDGYSHRWISYGKQHSMDAFCPTNEGDWVIFQAHRANEYKLFMQNALPSTIEPGMSVVGQSSEFYGYVKYVNPWFLIVVPSGSNNSTLEPNELISIADQGNFQLNGYTPIHITSKWVGVGQGNFDTRND